MKPLLGVTIGDPSGAGPEICIKALDNSGVADTARLVFFGDKNVMERARGIVGSKTGIHLIDSPEQYREGVLNLISLDNMPGQWDYGKVQASCGKAAFEFLKRAIEDAKAGKHQGVVTGPIHKEAMNQAGIHYSGMTEIFADLTDTRDYAMLLVGGPLKVIHVCTHLSMREACDVIRRDRVLQVIKLADETVKNLGKDDPVIAVAGLNPHSGENGLFGREEIEEITPAIEDALAAGLNVIGPVPPDTVFYHASHGRYDIVVAMYHDQGHIPLKLLDFMGGVNVTVGIPIQRTSVDHGTVFGKAGKGTADPGSMVKAIELGVQFALNRKG